MSQTKLEIFKIKISDNSKFDFDNKAKEKINLFLNNENTVYINHSTSIITEDIEKYGVNKTINKYLVISLIYKDLNASKYNLEKTNKKIKEVVKKEIEKGDKLEEPEIETIVEKEIRQLTKAISNAGVSEKNENNEQ